MPNLRDSLEFIGYEAEKHESLIGLFHVTGVLQEIYGEIFSQNLPDIGKELTQQQCNQLLDSNLALQLDANILEIAEKFNGLGQKKFKEIRGSGERQEMQATSKPLNFDKYITDLGLLKETLPESDIDLYVVFGASEAGVRNRINFVSEKSGKKLTEDNVTFLGGDRKLWPKYYGGDDELKKLIPGEDITFDIIKDLNPRIDIEAFKNEVNSFFEENKQNLQEKKRNITQLRSEIVENKSNIIWPTESDLEKKLAQEILGIKDAKVIEGEKDLKIGRPTTQTTLTALSQDKIITDKSGIKICMVSSQPHCKRQSEMAKHYLGQNVTVSYCGRGAESLLQNDSTNPALEAVLGEVNSLVSIAKEKQQQKPSYTVAAARATTKATSLEPQK